jgi:hypothetical protein
MSSGSKRDAVFASSQQEGIQMANNTKTADQESREATLYSAFQFGYSSVRDADGAAVKAEFDLKFGNDPEALEQFNAGVKDEEAKRAELGMTPGQYHAHYEAKNRAFHKRRDAIHAASLGR